MADLQIVLVDQQKWVIQIANTDINYGFAGDSLDEQLVSVQRLSASMQQGAEFLGNDIANIIEIPQGDDGAEVVEQLFNTTDDLYYAGDFVVGAIEGEKLLDILEEAGAALAELL